MTHDEIFETNPVSTSETEKERAAFARINRSLWPTAERCPGCQFVNRNHRSDCPARTASPEPQMTDQDEFNKTLLKFTATSKTTCNWKRTVIEWLAASIKDEPKRS